MAITIWTLLSIFVIAPSAGARNRCARMVRRADLARLQVAGRVQRQVADKISR
jgi:hypothetical protein